MPIYEFRDEESGETIEIYLHVGEAPRFGDTIDADGRTLRRIPSVPARATVKTWHVVAHSQPEWAQGAEGYTQTGTPLFSSKKAVQRYLDVQNKLTGADGQGEQGGEILGYDTKTNL